MAFGGLLAATPSIKAKGDSIRSLSHGEVNYQGLGRSVDDGHRIGMALSRHNVVLCLFHCAAAVGGPVEAVEFQVLVDQLRGLTARAA